MQELLQKMELLDIQFQLTKEKLSRIENSVSNIENSLTKVETALDDIEGKFTDGFKDMNESLSTVLNLVSDIKL
jgi:chaperonin cofactor prefoldin